MKNDLFLIVLLTALWSSCSNDVRVDLLKPEMFEDAVFWEFCLDNYDMDKDGGISFEEALAVKTMDVSGLNISSLKGIEYFTELTWLNCSTTNVDTLDLSHNPKIKYFKFDDYKWTLGELFLAKEAELEEFYVEYVGLKKIDFSSCKKLKKVLIGVSWITTLDLSNCPEMEELICKGGVQDKEGLNFIGEIDLSNCTKLKKLECINLYELKNLDISNCTALESLDIMTHNLREIDISNNRKLKRFYCLPLRDNYELTVYVWPGFEGIADSDYEDAGVSYKVNIVVAD